MLAIVVKATVHRIAAVLASIVTACGLGMCLADPATAFSEAYGFHEVGNGGYVESAGAHTFWWNDGGAGTGGRLACQLLNKSGVDEVEHGEGGCTVFYFGGAFVWARVYNEAGFTQLISGEAGTE